MLQTMGLRTGRSKKSDKFRLFQQPARSPLQSGACASRGMMTLRPRAKPVVTGGVLAIRNC
jgi:hypothetical protein